MYNNALLGAGDAMSLRKAAEMALEAWDNWAPAEPIDLENKIEALRQALAQPEQEPVCFIRETAWSYEIAPWDDPRGFPVYTAPPKREWVGLTDEEMFLISEYPECCQVSIRNAEAKLKEKNGG